MLTQMRVSKYLPDKLFGFAADSRMEVFFHLGSFDPKGLRSGHPKEGIVGWEWVSPPPILGELVSVTLPDTLSVDKAPRALRVERLEIPVAVTGEVEAFDPLRGYGFIKGSDGVSYHLHRSEMLGGHMPLPGNTVIFYAGTRQDRPRACHVKVFRG